MAETSVNVDVNQLVTDVIGTGDLRNDLGVVIENGIARDLTVTWAVENGGFEKSEGPFDPLPVSTTAAPTTLAIGVEAQGNGSGIFLYITAPGQHVWGIYARTPPNTENWYQYVYYAQSPAPSFDDTLAAVKDATTYYANQGPQTWNWGPNNSAPHSKVTILMTETHEAAASIQIQFLASD